MIEILAALISGVATVLASVIAKTRSLKELESLLGIGKRAEGANALGKQPAEAWPLQRNILLFIVAAVAGGLLIHVVTAAAETGLNTGGYKVPVGTIIAYIGAIPPDGWLLCDGSPIDRQYKELRKTVGGDNTPDLRGRFLRGLDRTGKLDHDGLTRALGSPQEDMVGPHTHTAKSQGQLGPGNAFATTVPTTPHSLTTDQNEGYETRPKNIAVNFIIKY